MLDRISEQRIDRNNDAYEFMNEKSDSIAIMSQKDKMLIHDAYYSTGGFRQGATKSYIYKYSKSESTKDYNFRKKITSHSPLLRSLIDIYLKPIWGSEKELTSTNKRVEGLFTDTQLTKNCNRAVRNLKLYGQTFYGLEYPSTYDTIPSINIIDSKDVIDHTYVGIDIVSLEWNEYKIYKGVRIPINCLFVNNSVTRTTKAYLTGDDKVVLKPTNYSTRITMFDSFNPICEFWMMGALEIDEDSENLAMAKIEVDIFNSQSMLKDFIMQARFSPFVIPTNDKMSEIKMGSKRAFTIPPDAKNLPQFVSVDDTPYEILKDDIQNMKAEMYKLISFNLLADNIKYTTAMSSLIASRSFDGEITYLYNSYKIMMNKLLNRMVSYYDIINDYKLEFSTITYNIDQINNEMESTLLE